MPLSQREKSLLVIPVVLGGALGVYNWVHLPLATRHAEALTKSDNVQMELKQEKARLAQAGDLASRREAAEARAAVVDAWVPGKNSPSLFVWYLSEAEKRSGAHITAISVNGSKPTAGATGAKGSAAPAGSGTTGAAATPGATTAQGSTAAPGAAAAAGTTPAQVPGQATSTPKSGSPKGADPASELTTVTYVLEVDGRFAEHLLFQQALEEMPLFMNTTAVSLTKNDNELKDKATKLASEGNVWLATQLLQSSPMLEGNYQITLYFKGTKAGPTTETMQFPEPAGRMDPFMSDGVGEFVWPVTGQDTKQGSPAGTQPVTPVKPAPPPASTTGQRG